MVYLQFCGMVFASNNRLHNATPYFLNCEYITFHSFSLSLFSEKSVYCDLFIKVLDLKR